MARPRKVSDAEIIHMIRDRKLTYSEIAAETGLTVSGVNGIVRRLRKSGQLPPANQADHKWAVPWKVATEHKMSKVARYLRELSATAQGRESNEDNRNTALRWARELVEQRLDVAYDREQPPNDFSLQGGFFVKKADPEEWHLKKVLDRANAGVLKKRSSKG